MRRTSMYSHSSEPGQANERALRFWTQTLAASPTIRTSRLLQPHRSAAADPEAAGLFRLLYPRLYPLLRMCRRARISAAASPVARLPTAAAARTGPAARRSPSAKATADRTAQRTVVVH